jgi:immunity protein 50 of polymorphic toxin system
MMKRIEYFFPRFENAHIVQDFFNKYPSLHDSEVIELTLNRELGFDFRGPRLFLTLYAFDSSALPESPNRKECKLQFVFEKVELVYIKDFNHQNAMADFEMDRYYCDRLKQERYKMFFGEFGAKISFTCDHIKVISIEPYKPIDYFKSK